MIDRGPAPTLRRAGGVELVEPIVFNHNGAEPMNRILGIFTAAALAFSAPSALSAADKADKKPGVQGTAKAIDAKANTITVTLAGKKGQPGEDKTFAIAPDAKVANEGKDGKLDDVKAGAQAALKLSDDGKSVVGIAVGARKPEKGDKAVAGKAVEIKAIDAKAGTITIAGKKADQTLKLAADAKVTLDGKDAKLADIKAGQAFVKLSEDGQSVVALAVGGQKPDKGDKAAAGKILDIKAVDATAGTVTVTTKKGDETLKLAADAKVTL